MPLIEDTDFTLHVGDALDVLRTLPDESAHCVVTSPPYWGLRDYSVPGQLGLEPTPEQYVENMVAVFREVRRVLRRDGTCWLNIGDSYNANQGAGFNAHEYTRPHLSGEGVGQKRIDEANRNTTRKRPTGIKPKDLVGMPWRLAFALQADGWYLRSDIIWAKPNPMPESVMDRPTKAHEYLFLLTRSPRYYFDQDAIREDYTPDDRLKRIHDHRVDGSHENHAAMSNGKARWAHAGRNKRSVWEIATEPYPDAHFATFPQALVEPCVLAGTSERGCCPQCGAPWERETESEIIGTKRNEQGHYAKHDGADGTNHYLSKTDVHGSRVVTTTGWRPTCECSYQDDLVRPHPVPCTVLDPFLVSGTTALVARRLGRRCVGIELSPEYAQLAARRTQQLSVFA